MYNIWKYEIIGSTYTTSETHAGNVNCLNIGKKSYANNVCQTKVIITSLGTWTEKKEAWTVFSHHHEPSINQVGINANMEY
jgi:hypothetical protein